MGRLRPAEAEEALSEAARSLGEKGRKGAVYHGLFGARAGGKLLGERPGPGSWLCPSLCYYLLHSFQGFDPGAKSSRCLRSWEQASCCVTSRPVTHSPPLARKALPLHLCSIILFLKGLPLYSPELPLLSGHTAVCLTLTLITVVWPWSSHASLPQNPPTTVRDNCPLLPQRGPQAEAAGILGAKAQTSQPGQAVPKLPSQLLQVLVRVQAFLRGVSDL